MKKSLLLLLCCLSVAVPVARAQQTLKVDGSGNPTIPLNLGGPNVVGGGRIVALNTSPVGPTPTGYVYQLYGLNGHIHFWGTTPASTFMVGSSDTPVNAVVLDNQSPLNASMLASGTTPAARVTADAPLTISGAGTAPIHLANSGTARVSRKITLAAGSGPYLAQLILDAPTAATGITADANGSWQDIRLEFAAGGNAGVQILAADGVTVLFSEAVTPSSSIPAYAVAAQFVCPSAWRLHDSFLTP